MFSVLLRQLARALAHRAAGDWFADSSRRAARPATVERRVIVMRARSTVPRGVAPLVFQVNVTHHPDGGCCPAGDRLCAFLTRAPRTSEISAITTKLWARQGRDEIPSSRRVAIGRCLQARQVSIWSLRQCSEAGYSYLPHACVTILRRRTFMLWKFIVA